MCFVYDCLCNTAGTIRVLATVSKWETQYKTNAIRTDKAVIFTSVPSFGTGTEAVSNRDSVVGLEDPGFESRHVKGLFSITSRPVFAPIQHPTQWVEGFSPVVKQPEREFNHKSPSSAYVKNEWSYTSNFALCLHGINRDNFTCTFFTRSRCSYISSSH